MSNLAQRNSDIWKNLLGFWVFVGFIERDRLPLCSSKPSKSTSKFASFSLFPSRQRFWKLFTAESLRCDGRFNRDQRNLTVYFPHAWTLATWFARPHSAFLESFRKFDIFFANRDSQTSDSEFMEFDGNGDSEFKQVSSAKMIVNEHKKWSKG